MHQECLQTVGGVLRLQQRSKYFHCPGGGGRAQLLTLGGVGGRTRLGYLSHQQLLHSTRQLQLLQEHVHQWRQPSDGQTDHPQVKMTIRGAFVPLEVKKSQPRKWVWSEVLVAGRGQLVLHTVASVVDVAGGRGGVLVGVAGTAPVVVAVSAVTVAVGVVAVAVVTSS